MPNTRVEFFPKAQMKEDYLRIAKIEGDEDKVLDYLNSLLEERRGQVIKTSEIPLDCANCSNIFCVHVCRRGKFLLLNPCCGMRNTFFTLKELLGSLHFEFGH
ncbi:MAG: hypothetical protein UR60_C0021G0005 [Candidatus Moranbacteria bacterium GW2011_GWF2_34_56]|nr:MAG: hypothetical protein UR51_C0008G0028 [Candidatus Moranbacteria bacterium GW2011_GWF1_34_10]KKP64437.1 MAG: hypothetical protein UR60_C0021G0005 [Candidatus Moranbacteria bacterium GW2011_GWF2_34_56]